MRAFIQRVTSASVVVDEEVIGKVGRGFAILLGISKFDTQCDAAYVVDKTVTLRIFPDEEGKFSRSALDVDADLLVISQFTLYANTRKGRRPSFTDAASPEKALILFDHAIELFRRSGLKVATGRFQSYMNVHISNDGPVSIMIDSREGQHFE